MAGRNGTRLIVGGLKLVLDGTSFRKENSRLVLYSTAGLLKCNNVVPDSTRMDIIDNALVQKIQERRR